MGRKKCNIPKMNICVRIDCSTAALLKGLGYNLVEIARDALTKQANSGLKKEQQNLIAVRSQLEFLASERDRKNMEVTLETIKAKQEEIQSVNRKITELQDDYDRRVKPLESAMEAPILKEKQKDAKEQQNQKALSLYRTFCTRENIREKDFAECLLNDDQIRGIGPMMEEKFSKELIKNGLPGDLNIIRPLVKNMAKRR